MPETNTVETKSTYGTKLSVILPQFLTYGRYECNFSPQTIQKYGGCISHIIKDIGDISIEELGTGHISLLKQKMFDRGAGMMWVATTVYVLKHLLKFADKQLGLVVLDPNQIKPPKRPKREVIYLTQEEVNKFIDSIKLENRYKNSQKGTFLNIEGLRFRTLVEVLLGSGARLSEALSLNRDSIDFDKGEAKIIGKGDKERVIFFNSRSIYWIKHYLEQRTDNLAPLFITDRGTRLSRADVSRIFQGYARKANINKHFTPHILRHTTATLLLLNGCPIGFIKEILGHEKLETTCKYYLGILDKVHAKQAHHQYLNY